MIKLHPDHDQHNNQDQHEHDKKNHYNIQEILNKLKQLSPQTALDRRLLLPVICRTSLLNVPLISLINCVILIDALLSVRIQRIQHIIFCIIRILPRRKFFSVQYQLGLLKTFRQTDGAVVS